LSVLGLPVAGSIGWSSHTSVAHSLLPPHVEIRTLVPPSSESQFPSGLAASAALVRKQNAIAAVFNALILKFRCGQVLVAMCFVVMFFVAMCLVVMCAERKTQTKHGWMMARSSGG